MSQFSKSSSLLSSYLTLKHWNEPVPKVLIISDFMFYSETLKWASSQSAHHFWLRVWFWNFEMSQFSRCPSLLTSCSTLNLWNEPVLKVLIASDFVPDLETLKWIASQSAHHFRLRVRLWNFDTSQFSKCSPLRTSCRLPHKLWELSPEHLDKSCTSFDQNKKVRWTKLLWRKKGGRLAGWAWCFDLKTDFWFKDSKNVGLNRD